MNSVTPFPVRNKKMGKFPPDTRMRESVHQIPRAAR